ncbi:MAG TPA: sigma-70 family RNA polymerase sigma factor [Anaerohalosphaeraceae bacterium]|nr:sigma-70 family RNA polymerase sigma factor [Anaerohalosphaeraceae bacterium]HOL88046.1 sigma-70 family RNA polymerase sigma factor [Anaerohalosphaeraceae bacterium]HPP55294.1 sigma-70 family RNA polymerase sigma factor [Anaerohalosphaeraceae bacterium]
MSGQKNTLFIELYSREQKKIFLYILSMVHRRSDAEDIMQQTAADMWRLFDRFEKGTNFASWGIEIARYRILSYRKKQNKNRLFLSEEVYSRIAEELQRQESSSDKRTKALEGCLKKLKESDRRLLSMHYEGNLNYGKIAEQLNLSKLGIYKVMARIHTALRRCINQTLLLWETNG